MKLLYIILAVFLMLLAGYMLLNDFTFDNGSFSNYLITTLVILLTSCIAVGGMAWLFAARKKNNYKGIMTIRQYYDYKSAR
ncbi:hypothetical protein OGH69_17325 [Flavobacterium sp. MFBS3-15]|uniref:hypothetical protein n=1 Tax=Flavobacterium sp. MFBS3-15 TaxID=2989816 RepID=UPI002235E013|nr:hypothetical protein [Flavobacterium sp. MFBS3-15]MCW4470737.1 hypothetical protein [Flavobacterium sp. MFBS3-15]